MRWRPLKTAHAGNQPPGAGLARNRCRRLSAILAAARALDLLPRLEVEAIDLAAEVRTGGKWRQSPELPWPLPWRQDRGEKQSTQGPASFRAGGPGKALTARFWPFSASWQKLEVI